MNEMSKKTSTDQAHGGEVIVDPSGDRYTMGLQTTNEAGTDSRVHIQVRAETTFRAINGALREYDGPRGRRVQEILWVRQGGYGSSRGESTGIQPVEITFQR